MYNQETKMLKKDTAIRPECPNCKNKDQITKLNYENGQLFSCASCHNTFLYPLPKNLSNFYPADYWKFPGQLSFIRSFLHYLLQLRRKNWVRNYLQRGKILDVGAGEGVFGKVLGSDFEVTNLESPFAQVSNKDVVKADFLKWNTTERFDGIVFLESLEHIPSPQQYLQKAKTLLKKSGYIFVECPRFDCWESKIFKDKWLHLDIPRHLAHLSKEGLGIIAKRNKLNIISQTGMSVYEFSPYCFTVSLMLYLGIKPLNLRRKSISNLISILLALALLPMGVVAETIFHLFDQDPVQLSVFKKD